MNRRAFVVAGLAAVAGTVTGCGAAGSDPCRTLRATAQEKAVAATGVALVRDVGNTSCEYRPATNSWKKLRGKGVSRLRRDRKKARTKAKR